MQPALYPPTHPAPGDVITGKYRVENVIGKGGMGAVLAARHLVTGKRVALKWILDPQSDNLRVRFVREARAAGRIHHPNVVDVYDVLEHEDTTCLVMELLSGEPLSSLLAREQVLSPKVAMGIAMGIARGLAAAHAEGVIHRDLKPGNIFLTEGVSPSGVKILDFGISKIVDPTDAAPPTESGAVLGTPHYMAPEQVLGTGNSDPSVDLYALGAVLYEMLAGQPPHQHEKVTALLVAIATTPPKPIEAAAPDVPPALAELVNRTLSKSPNDRPASVAAFAAELEALSGVAFSVSGPQAIHSVPPSPSSPGSLNRREIEERPTEQASIPGRVAAEGPSRVGVGVAIALVVAIVAGAIWAMQPDAAPAPVIADASAEHEAPTPPTEPAEVAPVVAPEITTAPEPSVGVVESPEATATRTGRRRERDEATPPVATAPTGPSTVASPSAEVPTSPSPEVSAPVENIVEDIAETTRVTPATPGGFAGDPEAPRAGRIGLDDF